jgi:hypothetical protein
MTTSRAARLKAEGRVREAVAEYNGSEVSAEVGEYDSGNVYTLSQREIDEGVVAMLLQCGISHGSAADIDLYRLVGVYLRDLDARREINAVFGNGCRLARPAILVENDV